MQKNEGKGRASSADILGNTERQESDPRWQEQFEKMIDVRDELIARRVSLGETSALQEHDFNANPADRGTDEYENGERFVKYSSDQDVLFEIEAALRRIENGSYGICEATGQPIPEDRLEAVPWTRFARDVEEAVEREENARKPRHAL